MPRASRSLIPPARQPGEGPPAPPELYVEPQNDIELLGEMLHDQATIGEMLRELPFDRAHYRGNLRVVLGAAVRMRDRCVRLLGEAEELQPEEHENRVRHITVEEESNIIDARVAEDLAHFVETVVDTSPEPALPHRRNGNGKPPAEPQKKAHEYSVVESFIMSELKDRGMATTRELVDFISKERIVPPGEIEGALANLRVAKKVTTTRLGRGLINRIAV